MPNVEFECSKCGNKFTMHRQFVDPDSDVKCPKCGTRHPRRDLSSLKSKLIYMFSSGSQQSSCGACNA
jgi:putative FmdB family regulatory protein